MNRRNFVSLAAATGLAAPAAPAESNAIYELRWFQLRSGNQVQRTSDFLGKHFVPAAQRAGVGPMGFFNAVIAEQSPFVLALISYPSMQAVVDATDKMASDPEFQKGFEEYNSMSELSYIRMESSLLRAFDGHRSIAVPPAQKTPRMFELRVYEGANAKASKTKIRMFNQGEIKVFQKVGFAPVFYGEALAGRNLPNLAYMVAFNDLTDRDEKWKVFNADPDWVKIRSASEFADAVVSNTSNSILRPLPFSQIR
jgi:hypothetical protein